MERHTNWLYSSLGAVATAAVVAVAFVLGYMLALA